MGENQSKSHLSFFLCLCLGKIFCVCPEEPEISLTQSRQEKLASIKPPDVHNRGVGMCLGVSWCFCVHLTLSCFLTAVCFLCSQDADVQVHSLSYILALKNRLSLSCFFSADIIAAKTTGLFLLQYLIQGPVSLTMCFYTCVLAQISISSCFLFKNRDTTNIWCTWSLCPSLFLQMSADVFIMWNSKGSFFKVFNITEKGWMEPFVHWNGLMLACQLDDSLISK